MSATKSTEPTKASPVALFMPLCVRLMPLVVKLGCPSTLSAAAPLTLAFALLKMRTRLFAPTLPSPTNKFVPSVAIRVGLPIPVAVTAVADAVKFGCPKTRSALSPLTLLPILSNATTRTALLSET